MSAKAKRQTKASKTDRRTMQATMELIGAVRFLDTAFAVLEHAIRNAGLEDGIGFHGGVLTKSAAMADVFGDLLERTWESAA